MSISDSVVRDTFYQKHSENRTVIAGFMQDRGSRQALDVLGFEQDPCLRHDHLPCRIWFGVKDPRNQAQCPWWWSTDEESKDAPPASLFFLELPYAAARGTLVRPPPLSSWRLSSPPCPVPSLPTPAGAGLELSLETWTSSVLLVG